ncbi:hypothetical protein EON64_07010 [archaeon]|nr:MAG: hypothetical protein EON64_07010 [archaeon]
MWRAEAFYRFFPISAVQLRRLHMSSWNHPASPSSNTGADGKVYLIVPFDEKDMAKQMGARWDPEAKLWYAQSDDHSLLQRWPAVGSLAGSAANKQAEQRMAVGSKAFLTVPFDERHEAKALGARWDVESKMWCAPNHEPELVQRWGKPNSAPKKYAQSQPAVIAVEEAVQKSWKAVPSDINERIYLDVPYEEKDEAKGMGARFCRERKLWYTTDRQSPLLERWNMKDERLIPAKNNNIIPKSFDEAEKYIFDDAQ